MINKRASRLHEPCYKQSKCIKELRKKKERKKGLEVSKQ